MGRTNPFEIFRFKASNLLAIQFIAFFIMLLITGLFQVMLGGMQMNERTAFYLTSSFQAVFVFIFPALLAAFLCCGRPLDYLGVESKFSLREIAGVILLFVLATPLLNAIVDWNANVRFPDSMRSLYDQLREWEDNAAEITEIILSDASVGSLIAGVLIIGLLTGLAEETFFRAGLQNAIIKSGANRHVAVWVAALIFSALHFQFFGFIPRLLLGACFGYIFLYTGSLWVAAFAHALNNSVVVIIAWLSARGYLEFEPEKIGTGYDNDLWIAFLSGILVICFICFLWTRFFRPRLTKN